MATRERLESFVQSLSPTRGGEVFNPWQEYDRELDLDPESPRIRRRHLRHYLRARLHRARVLLIGEALGYQGGRFSGVPMVSERILLGGMRAHGMLPEHVLPDLTPRRTSKPDLRPQGFAEPTATIVWKAILASQLDPLAFACWNVFPWHPFQPSKGRLSNRKPRRKELDAGASVLQGFLGLFPDADVVAVGRVAERAAERLGIPAQAVRHPAQGGANTFRRQMEAFLKAQSAPSD